MNCTHCQKPMIILELEQVEIDTCTHCGGLWLDRGELDLLLEDAGASQKLLSRVSDLERIREKNIPCPRCGTPMEKHRAGSETQAVIDSCPHHHGIWFDHGELAVLLNQANTEESQKVAALLRNMFQHQLSTPST